MSAGFSAPFFVSELTELTDNAKDPNQVRKGAGETIVEQGEKGSFMFYIEKGTAQVVFNGAVLEVASSGDIVGEMALIDSDPRSASIIAETDCHLIPISKWRFLHLVRKHPEFSLHVMQVMNRRLRKMNERIAAS
jgi:CRP/FNR family transcriptional regulator, cyclic AMP receptor protein